VLLPCANQSRNLINLKPAKVIGVFIQLEYPIIHFLYIV